VQSQIALARKDRIFASITLCPYVESYTLNILSEISNTVVYGLLWLGTLETPGTDRQFLHPYLHKAVWFGRTYFANRRFLGFVW